MANEKFELIQYFKAAVAELQGRGFGSNEIVLIGFGEDPADFTVVEDTVDNFAAMTDIGLLNLTPDAPPNTPDAFDAEQPDIDPVIDYAIDYFTTRGTDKPSKLVVATIHSKPDIPVPDGPEPATVAVCGDVIAPLEVLSGSVSVDAGGTDGITGYEVTATATVLNKSANAVKPRVTMYWDTQPISDASTYIEDEFGTGVFDSLPAGTERELTVKFIVGSVPFGPGGSIPRVDLTSGDYYFGFVFGGVSLVRTAIIPCNTLTKLQTVALGDPAPVPGAEFVASVTNIEVTPTAWTIGQDVSVRVTLQNNAPFPTTAGVALTLGLQHAQGFAANQVGGPVDTISVPSIVPGGVVTLRFSFNVDEILDIMGSPGNILDLVNLAAIAQGDSFYRLTATATNFTSASADITIDEPLYRVLT